MHFNEGLAKDTQKLPKLLRFMVSTERLMSVDLLNALCSGMWDVHLSMLKKVVIVVDIVHQPSMMPWAETVH